MIVRSKTDLSLGRLQGVKPGDVLLLKPSGSLVRDAGFVEAVASTALDLGLSVEIEGSPLAHPFYMLRRLGVPVACIQTPRPIARVHRYEKLVRDNVPRQIEAGGEGVVAYSAIGPERGEVLRAKVVEEALEVARAYDRESLLGEVADLTEVLRALQDYFEIADEEVHAEGQRKKHARGGFDRSLVLVQTSSEPMRLAASDAGQQPLPGLEDLPQRAERRPIRRDGRRLLVSYAPPLTTGRSDFRVELGSVDLQISFESSGIGIELVETGRDKMIGDALPGL